VRKRQFPIVGDGGSVSSFIHLDAAAAATVLALEHDAAGICRHDDPDRRRRIRSRVIGGQRLPDGRRSDGRDRRSRRACLAARAAWRGAGALRARRSGGRLGLRRDLDARRRQDGRRNRRRRGHAGGAPPWSSDAPMLPVVASSAELAEPFA